MGRRNQKVILDETGREVLYFMDKYKDFAPHVVNFLNGKVICTGCGSFRGEAKGVCCPDSRYVTIKQFRDEWRAENAKRAQMMKQPNGVVGLWKEIMVECVLCDGKGVRTFAAAKVMCEVCQGSGKMVKREIG